MSNRKIDLLSVYQDMLLLRRFEEKVGQLYGMGLIGGFCHLYIGQEAVAIGIKNAILEKDTAITSYRDHGFAIALGTPINSVMAELLGKKDGCSKGKGGSMHMFDVKNGFFGGHGIVGSQVSIGTGIAFSHKYKKNNNISVTIYGDGAAHQGQVYESFNMAKLWNLPVLYVIENNKYGMGTSVDRASCTKDLYLRGKSFDIPGVQIDGMNFFDVYKGVKEAADFVRKNNSPMLLEIKTYRYKGHSMSDAAGYRSKEEVEEYKYNDPIKHMKDHILENNISDVAALQKIDKSVKKMVNESIEFAENNPEPDMEELYKDVYR